MKTFYDESLRLLKEIPANNPSLRSWAVAHLIAIERPRAGISSAIGQLISGLIAYAEEHQAAYDSPISDDYVLGPASTRADSSRHPSPALWGNWTI